MRVVLAVLGLLLAGLASADERPAHGLIIKWKAAVREQALFAQDAEQHVRALLGKSGLAVTRTRPVGETAQHLDFGRVLPAAEARQMAERLAARPDVEWVVPNVRERRLQATNPPNDPFFATTATRIGQWWLYTKFGSNSNAIAERRRGVPDFQSAWMTQTGVPAAVVAVLDTGILRNHPDLAGRTLAGYDFVAMSVYANDGGGRDSDPSDPGDWVSQADIDGDPANFGTCIPEFSSWHGTVIAGLVAAATNEGTGVAGINWNGRVLPVRVAGKCGADVTDIVDGMRWAAGLPVTGAPANPNPARVVNISFGGSGVCQPYQETIDTLRAQGVVVVAAAGNEQGVPVRPAKCPGVVGVGAVNRDGFKTNYSNFGPELMLATVGGDPDTIGAWGRQLGDPGLLTVNNEGATGPGRNDYAYLFGTSFSAPLVAGAVSLMLSVNPALTYQQITDGLRASARPHVTSSVIGTCSQQNPGRCICTTTTCGAGLLDAAQAVLYAQNPTGYVPPARQGENIDSADVIAAAASGADEMPASTGPIANVQVNEGSGGGALGLPWLVALAFAASLLRLSAARSSSPGRAGTARPKGRPQAPTTAT